MCIRDSTITACATAVCLMNQLPISIGTVIPFDEMVNARERELSGNERVGYTCRVDVYKRQAIGRGILLH